MAEPVLRWIAPDGSRTPLGKLLNRLGVAPRALAAGAVFLNRQRAANPASDVVAGDVVEVYLEHAAAHSVRVLEQRAGLTIVDKPSELASEPTHRGGQDSVVQQLERVMGTAVHAASRLDVGVSGLMLLSTSPAGHAHLERLRSRGLLTKRYLGLACGALAPQTGHWQSRVARGGKQLTASTRYCVVEQVEHRGEPPKLSLLRLVPESGRTHQLRLHCAEAGVPLLGDRRHAGATRLVRGDGSVLALDRILLHASELELTDLAGEPWRVTLRPPEAFEQVWRAAALAEFPFDQALTEDSAPRAR